MKKSNLFFTEKFLDECQHQSGLLETQITTREAFGVIRDLNSEEILVAKLFYNRLLWLLYNGGRLTQEEFIMSCYLLE